MIILVTKKESESIEEAFWFILGAYNPLGFLDVASYGTRRGIAQKAVGIGSLYTAAKIISGPMSGGGATPQAAKYMSRTSWASIPSLKIDGWSKAARTAPRVLGVVARGAVRSLPFVAAYYAVQGYYRHLAELDWVPDLYQNPLG